MEDKEVGELWRELLDMHDLGLITKERVQALIRKLVEERSWLIAYRYYKTTLIYDAEAKLCRQAAVRDFGIDPKEFNHD